MILVSSLNQWFSTCGSQLRASSNLFHRGHLRLLGSTDIYITIQNSSKIRVMRWQQKVILWLGGQHTWRTVLRGHSIRKVENHCPNLHVSPQVSPAVNHLGSVDCKVHYWPWQVVGKNEQCPFFPPVFGGIEFYEIFGRCYLSKSSRHVPHQSRSFYKETKENQPMQVRSMENFPRV